ncbi:MAG TPA: FAD/NAD(P)-binding protein [Conexibacter sp.]|jgi:uncharacterized NAD(P)/FAD-binding protein YdhS
MTVVIVGAGFAGTLVAVNLLRRGMPMRIVLVERTGRFGTGVAYATHDLRHRLNVVAERMSALADEPGHFSAWARRNDGVDARGAYLPRARYGVYLRELLDRAMRDAPPGCELERVDGEAVNVDVDVDGRGRGASVLLADGRRIAADDVVLALGSLPAISPVALPDDPRVVADPWARGALDDVTGEHSALMIGAGLTAVDVALTVTGDNERARLVAVSRSGCLPYDHLPGLRAAVPAPAAPATPTTVEALERWLMRHVARMRRDGHDWRDVIDGLRPQLNPIWQSLPHEEKRRFVHERSRAWDLRRHRMAPEVAGRVRRLLTDGRLLVRAGRVVAVRALPRTLEVLVDGAGAGSGELRTLRADRVIACAGPGTDITTASSPLLRALLHTGTASADPLKLGLRVTPTGTLVAANGQPQPRLHLLGPLRRGQLWETTAVPEIREQAAALAQALAFASA